MALFSRFFKRKEPETLEQKIAALESAGVTERLRMAKEAPEADVRAAAIGGLPYSQDLVNMALTNNSAVATAARRRLGHLLDEGTISVDNLAKKVSDPALLVQLCAYSSQAGTGLVEQLDDEEMLLPLAENGATTQLRQAAATKIRSFDRLSALAKTARGKDKAVYKIVKAKLDVFKLQQQQKALRDDELRSLCSQMEQLAKRKLDDIFTARLSQIHNAWQAMATEAEPDLKHRFQEAADRCQAKLDEAAAEQRAAAEKEARDLAAKQQLLDALLGLEQFIIDLYTSENTAECAERVPQLEAGVERALTEVRAENLDTQQESKRAETLLQTARALLLDLQQHGTLAELNAQLLQETGDDAANVPAAVKSIIAHARVLKKLPPPNVVAVTLQHLNNWLDQRKARQQAGKQQLAQMDNLLRRARWAIDNGHVGRSRAILRDISALAAKLDRIPPATETKIADLQASVSKLGDWHEFAVTPKKQALIEQMQALAGSNLEPTELADRIQQLQKAWRELCRGGQNQDESLWAQFQEASQQAYQPCEAHFAEQNRIREENASNRHTLLAQLREYLDAYDWENAQWKEVESTLQLSRQAWQSYWPIPRRLVKDLQAEFDQVLDALYAKLNAEYERNRAKKQALLAQAEQLLALSDSRMAIEQAKQLQQQWQAVGRCKRKDDQKLWQNFRKHCDAVFAKRQTENEQLKAEREAAKQEAERLLEEINSCLALQGQALLNAREQIDGYVQAFKAIGELPRDSSKTMAGRFDTLMDQLEQKLAKARTGLQRQRWLDVLAAADLIRQYELAVLAGEEASAPAELATAVLEKAALWPAGAYSQLELRVNVAPKLSEDQQQEAINTLRRLCIRSEVVLGQESPDQDKAARMEYQVALLQQGLGQAELPDDNTLADVILEWLSAPAVPDQSYHIYLKRLDKAWGLGLPQGKSSAVNA